MEMIINSNGENNILFNENHLRDEELLGPLKSSNNEATAVLLQKYVPLVKTQAALFKSSGIECEDLVQEGMIGLASAIKAYNPSISSFSTFARICINRSMIAAVRKNSHKRVIPKDLFDDSLHSETEVGLKGSNEDNPENLFFARNDYLDFQQEARFKLSDMEYNVLCYHISGYSYKEISERLSLTAKSVDNAIQRIRCKLK